MLLKSMFKKDIPRKISGLLAVSFVASVQPVVAANWGGQSTAGDKTGVWQEVHCEEGKGWQLCQPPPCEPVSVSWGACGANLPKTLLNATVTVANARAGYSGQATYQCADYQLYSQWTYISGTCVADPPPPAPVEPPAGGTPPAPGTTLYVSAFICGSAQAGYYSGPGSVSLYWKNRIIGTYKDFNIGGRCPEAGGYIYWQQDLSNRAASMGFDEAWKIVEGSMKSSAAANGEQTQAFVDVVMRAFCTDIARGMYGPSVTAAYVMNSGNLCRLD